jgi:hypothetical protein
MITPDSSSSSSSDHSNVLPNWQLVLEAAFIDCANMLDYSVNNEDPTAPPIAPCQLCLLNKACSWCPPPAAAKRFAERSAEWSAERSRRGYWERSHPTVNTSAAGVGCVLTSELMSEGGVPHQCHSRCAVQHYVVYCLALHGARA